VSHLRRSGFSLRFFLFRPGLTNAAPTALGRVGCCILMLARNVLPAELIVTTFPCFRFLDIVVLLLKVEVKKKHVSNGWNFSCFSAHRIERELF
jgi:hypothetical protein